MKIFNTIKSSIYNPGFYKNEKSASLGKPLSFLIKITLIESLLYTVYFCILILALVTYINKPDFPNTVASYFPEELKLIVKNGSVSTNVVEPYTIPFKTIEKDSKPNTPVNYKHKNLIVIDTKSGSDISAFNKYDTDVLITKDYIIRENNSNISVQSIKSLPDMTLDRTKIVEWVNIAKSYVKVFVPIMIILMYITFIISKYFGHIISISILSAILFVILKLTNMPMKYSEIFKLGCYSIVPVLLINVLLTFIGMLLPWYLFIAGYIAIFIVNTKNIK